MQTTVRRYPRTALFILLICIFNVAFGAALLNSYVKRDSNLSKSGSGTRSGPNSLSNRDFGSQPIKPDALQQSNLDVLRQDPKEKQTDGGTNSELTNPRPIKVCFCNSRGICTESGDCVCSEGWEGQNCSTKIEKHVYSISHIGTSMGEYWNVMGRFGHAAILIPSQGKNYLWVFGGASYGNANDQCAHLIRGQLSATMRLQNCFEILRLDLSTNRWERVAYSGDEAPSKLIGHTATPYVDKHTNQTNVLIFGGSSDIGHLVTDAAAGKFSFASIFTRDARNLSPSDNLVHIFNLETKQWTVPDQDNNFKGNVFHTATLQGDRVLFFGGQPDAVNSALTQLISYDIYSGVSTASKTTGHGPSPRRGHAAVLYNGDQLLVFGGHVSDTDLYSLDLKTMVWSIAKTEGFPPSPRFGHTMTIVGNQTFIIGGFDYYGAAGNSFILDQGVTPWTWQVMRVEVMLKPLPLPSGDHPIMRYSHSTIPFKDQFLMFGGFTAHHRLHPSAMFSMVHESDFPRVTVILAIVDDSVNPLLAAERVLDQSYRNFELLIVVMTSAPEGTRYGFEDVMNALSARGHHVRVHVIRTPAAVVPEDSEPATTTTTTTTAAANPASTDQTLSAPQPKTITTVLNAGHLLAQGQYVTWIDPDTRWHVDFLKEMVGGLDSHPSATMVYCDHSEYQPDERVLIRIVHHQGYLFRELLTFSSFPRGVLYRHEMLNTVRPQAFDLLPTEYEEWAFLVRIVERFEVVHVPSMLVKTVVRPPIVTSAGTTPNVETTTGARNENGDEETAPKLRESIYGALRHVIAPRSDTSQPLSLKMVPLEKLYPSLPDCLNQEEARFTAFFDLGIRLLLAEKQPLFDDGLLFLEEALALRPKFTILNVYIGAGRLLQQKWRQAKKTLEQAENNLTVVELLPTVEALKDKVISRDSSGIGKILPALQFEESELMRKERGKFLKQSVSKPQRPQ